MVLFWGHRRCRLLIYRCIFRLEHCSTPLLHFLHVRWISSSRLMEGGLGVTMQFGINSSAPVTEIWFSSMQDNHTRIFSIRSGTSTHHTGLSRLVALVYSLSFLISWCCFILIFLVAMSSSMFLLPISTRFAACANTIASLILHSNSVFPQGAPSSNHL